MRLSKKIVAMLAAGALSLGMLGLLGCSGGSSSDASTEEESQSEVIEVTGSGATVQKKNAMDAAEGIDNIANAYYAFTVENHREGMVAKNITFNLAGYNENNEIVFTGGSVLECAYPGISTVVTGISDMDAQQSTEGPVSRVEVLPVLSDVEWVKCELTASELENLFSIENEEATGENDILTVTASVTGNLSLANKIEKTTTVENDLLGAHGTLLLFDSEGNILMGSQSSSVLIDQEFLDQVKAYKNAESSGNPEDSAPINLISSIENPPDFDRYQLYVMPGLA